MYNHTALLLILSFLYNVQTTRGQCYSVSYLDAVSDEQRILSSPYYPSDYPDNANCEWIITAPSDNHRVLLTIYDVQLESSCDYDGIVFKAGDEDSGEIGRLCGQDNPGSITSRGRSIYIRLYSDSSVQHKGFRLAYKSFPVGESCPSGWTQRNSMCYRLQTNATVRDEAQQYCAYSASNLVSIGDMDENLFLTDTMAGWQQQYVWIGLLYHSNHSYSWVDHLEYKFTRWRSEPADTSEHPCTAIDVRSGYWEQEPCDTYYPYICKKNLAGTTVVYEIPPSATTVSGSFNFWEIPGIIIAVIVFGSVAYGFLRHCCEGLKDMCECCFDSISTCCGAVHRNCSTCSELCGECSGGCCAIFKGSRARTASDPPVPEIHVIGDTPNGLHSRQLSLTLIDINADVSPSRSRTSSTTSDSVITLQPRLTPSAPSYNPSAPPPSYEDLTFIGGTSGPPDVDVPFGQTIEAPPPAYPPPSYDDVTTSST